MSEKSPISNGPHHHDGEGESALSTKDEAARVFVRALDEAYWARVRAGKRTRVVGIHGTDFERRDSRAELVVTKFNERAVKAARKNALRAGWTKDQLAALALTGAEGSNGADLGSDSARA